MQTLRIHWPLTAFSPCLKKAHHLLSLKRLERWPLLDKISHRFCLHVYILFITESTFDLMLVKNVASPTRTSFLLRNLTQLLCCVHCSVLSPGHQARSPLERGQFSTLFMLRVLLSIVSTSFVDGIVFLPQVDEIAKRIAHGLTFIGMNSWLRLHWRNRFSLQHIPIVLVTVRV